MSDLPTNPFGSTGVEVTKLGYGAMELRGASGVGLGRAIEPEDADAILNAVLDAGIDFVDTAPDYGDSEELIGRFLAHRRDEYFLASKCGCAVDSPTVMVQHVWTPEVIRAGVEQSLRRMRTDHLDLVQLHGNPSRETMEEQGSIEALQALKDEGKVRFFGMSGNLPNLPDHVAMGVFEAFQIPYSALEREHEQLIDEAAATGAGIVIRGGVARGVPNPDEALRPPPPDASDLVKERFEVMRSTLTARYERFERIDLSDLAEDGGRMELLLRFTISHPGMHTTIVGTRNPEHLAANVAAARKGPLPADVYEEVKRRLS
jgi:aryl-alcohol dehydrogenase-like predicted oxidoreductase